MNLILNELDAFNLVL